MQLLKGKISVRSRLGEGTEVTVEVPLLHEKDAYPAVTTGSTAAPLARRTSDMLVALQKQSKGRKIAYYGFEGCEAVRKSVAFYASQWYQMASTEDVMQGHIVVVAEGSLTKFLETIKGKRMLSCIISLCGIITKHELSRVEYYNGMPIQWMSKPVGPYKFGKVLQASWKYLEPAFDDQARDAAHTTEECEGKESSTTSPLGQPNLNPGDSPNIANAVTYSTLNKDGAQCVAHDGLLGLAIPTEEPSFNGTVLPLRVATTAAPAAIRTAAGSTTPDTGNKNSIKDARILCVDDNQINLKLLRAYMKKLGFTTIQCAEDGLQAFQSVESSTESFDLIFMGMCYHQLCTIWWFRSLTFLQTSPCRC